jgi:hypothetical protein
MKMKSKKKKKPLGPRCKRMNRNSRLQAAKHWIPKYEGNNILRGYKNHFGIDWECAIKELELLGIQLNPQYVLDIRRSREAEIRNRQAKKQAKEQAEEESEKHCLFGWDEHFAFIAGFTANGVPYGVTWEEMGIPGYGETEEEIW